MAANKQFDQTPFDFNAFNNLTNNTPAGMKLALAISLLNGAWMSYARFNNPLAADCHLLLSDLKDFQLKHKAAQNARAAAAPDATFNRQAVGAQITRLMDKLANAVNVQEITTLSNAIDKLERALKDTPVPVSSSNAIDSSAIPKLGQADMMELFAQFQKMQAALAQDNQVAAHNAAVSTEQVQDGVLHQQGDALAA